MAKNMAPPMARMLQFISAIVGSIEDGQKLKKTMMAM
jgi:hypothetical protein